MTNSIIVAPEGDLRKGDLVMVRTKRGEGLETFVGILRQQTPDTVELSIGVDQASVALADVLSMRRVIWAMD